MNEPLSSKTGDMMQQQLGVCCSPLSQAEDALRTIFDNAYDGIVLHSSDGTIFEANDTFLQMYRARREDLPSLTIQLISSPSMRMEVADSLWRSVLQGEPQLFEWKAKRLDGTEFDAEVYLRLIRLQGGGAILANIRDLSARKQTEAILREQSHLAQLRADATHLLQAPAATEDLLQNLATLLVDGFDAAFVRIWTFDGPSHILELRASAGMYTHLDGPHGRVPLGQFKIGRIAQERRSIITNQVVGDPDIPNQSWVLREGIISFAGVPLISEGQLVGVIAFFARHELSPRVVETFQAIAGTLAQALARKQAEVALRRAKDEWERTFNSVPDLIAIIDSQHRIVRINQALADRLGCDAEQHVGKLCYECLHGLPAPPDNCPHLLAIHDLATRTGEIREARLGGVFLVSSTPLLDEKGDIFGTVHVSRDISEQKRAESELRAAREALARTNEELERKVEERTRKLRETVAELEQFSYTLTHDMRAPLRAMQGLGGLLLKEGAECGEASRHDYIRRIASAAARMDKLITDALQYSRTMREACPMEPVDPKPLLEGIIETYPELQVLSGRVQFTAHLPLVLGNEAALTQCFSNLLSNAVKFAKPGEPPTLRVSAEIRGHSARLWFEDSGIGIPPQYVDKIWVMFQKLDRSTEGTGIGLALVRKAVERMDGKCGVESEPGKGSRFWINLKRAEPAPQI